MLVRRLDQNHDMTFGQGLANYAVDAESVAQRVYTRLQLLKGEWFLDIDAGVPYLSEILVKPAQLDLAESIIKAVILLTDGVKELTSFDLMFNRETRKLAIEASALTDFDTISDIKVKL